MAENAEFLRIQLSRIFENHDIGLAVETGGILTVENCRVVSSNTHALDCQQGNCIISKSTFRGAGDDCLSFRGTHLEVTDSTVEAEERTIDGAGLAIAGGANVTIEFLEVAQTGGNGITVTGPSELQITNTHIRHTNYGIRAVVDENGPLVGGSEFRYLHIEETQADNIRVVGASRGNYEISHCLLENPSGRCVLLLHSIEGYPPVGWEVHHCKCTISEGRRRAGNEAIESFFGEDIHFDHCWVTEAPEDAYEHAFPISNVSVTNCVGDNVAVELVNFYLSGGRESGNDPIDIGPTRTEPNRIFEFDFLVDDRTDLSWNGDGYLDTRGEVSNIYGDCGKNAVAIGGLRGININGIFVETPPDVEYIQL